MSTRISCVSVVLVTMILLVGCNTTPSGGGGSTSNTNTNANSNSNANTTPVSGDTITVVLRNESDAVVETRFYATTESLASLPEELFVEDYLMTAGIGVAGTGMLIPMTQDTIELECDEDLLLGTDGGVFLDPDLGETLGSGTARWVQQGSIFDCGAAILFTYKAEEDGETYTVSFSHE